jgi:hypothetical protein
MLNFNASFAATVTVRVIKVSIHVFPLCICVGGDCSPYSNDAKGAL